MAITLGKQPIERDAELLRTLLFGLTDWTPTVNQGGAVAATVNYAKYLNLNGLVIITAGISVTAAGAAGSAIIIGGVPSAVAMATTSIVIGSGRIYQTGVTNHVGGLWVASASTFNLLADGNTNFVGVTPNFALANGDAISLMGVYHL